MQYLLLIILLLCSCGKSPKESIKSSNSTQRSRKTSDGVTDKEKRICELSKEIVLFTPIHDAEYNLFNVNGFSNSRISLPGASSWNYVFQIKIDTGEIDRWTEGMRQYSIAASDTLWLKKIRQNSPKEWQRNSTPELFKREEAQVSVLVFREEGIIYKNIIQQ